MRKLFLLVPILLIISGCATSGMNQYQAAVQACQSRVAYRLDANRNLVETTPNCSGIPQPRGNTLSTGEVWLIAGAVAGGLYLIYKLIDENNATKTVVAPQQNPLVQTGGTQSWSADYIQPIYTPIQ